ncbi:MAG: hypothetical protein ACC633_01065, partial [Anaerolineales bacterium]
SGLGHTRLHTDSEEKFLYPYLWDLLIRRINLDYSKKLRDKPDYHQDKTTIIEFARGKSHGGFSRAFTHLSKEIAESLAILFINVSWEESLRKNRARFNPDKPDSILEHGLSDEKIESLYRYSDWDEITAEQPDFLQIQDISVPYIVFENEDDVTSLGDLKLSTRLEKSLTDLFVNYQLGKNDKVVPFG